MRHFSYMLIALSVLLIGCGEKLAPESTNSKEVAQAKVPPKLDRKEKANKIREGANGQSVRVDLSSLPAKKLSDLYARFLGIPDGPVPRQANIDFEKNLAHLWAGKIERTDSSDSTQANVERVLAYYRANKNKMALKEFVRLADKEISLVKANIDWAKLCRIERLNGERCQILRAISKGIVGKDIIAYGMTEIFPSPDGALNVAFLDLLLRQAGAEYVDSLPAIHDGYLSFGFYQFTSFAIYDASDEKRGASIVNRAVTGSARIPGSVIALRNGDHHRAAFMFAVHNIATLLRIANVKEVKNLGKFHAKHQDEIVQFIAIAHHLPGPAIKGARHWMGSGMKKELQVSLKSPLRDYAHKTQGNLAYLYKVL